MVMVNEIDREKMEIHFYNTNPLKNGFIISTRGKY